MLVFVVLAGLFISCSSAQCNWCTLAGDSQRNNFANVTGIQQDKYIMFSWGYQRSNLQFFLIDSEGYVLQASSNGESVFIDRVDPSTQQSVATVALQGYSLVGSFALTEDNQLLGVFQNSATLENQLFGYDVKSLVPNGLNITVEAQATIADVLFDDEGNIYTTMWNNVPDTILSFYPNGTLRWSQTLTISAWAVTMGKEYIYYNDAETGFLMGIWLSNGTTTPLSYSQAYTSLLLYDEKHDVLFVLDTDQVQDTWYLSAVDGTNGTFLASTLFDARSEFPSQTYQRLAIHTGDDKLYVAVGQELTALSISSIKEGEVDALWNFTIPNSGGDHVTAIAATLDHLVVLATASGSVFIIESSNTEPTLRCSYQSNPQIGTPWSLLAIGLNEYIYLSQFENTGNLTVLNSTSCLNACSGNGWCNESAQDCNCKSGFYGLDCSILCDETTCTGNRQCSQNGSCLCNQGWTGDSCNIATCGGGRTGKACERQKQLTYYLIGGIGGGALLLITISVIIVCTYRRRKSRKKSEFRPLLASVVTFGNEIN